MANEKNLKKWKKGQSGNPKGRPRKLVSSVIAKLKDKGCEQVDKNAVKQVYQYLIGLTKDELTKMSNDSEVPMIFQVTAKSILSKSGFEIIETMLDRAHGKATQNTKLGTSEEGFSIKLIDARSSNTNNGRI